MPYFINIANVDQVICSGENYYGIRTCNYNWIVRLRDESESRFICNGVKL